MKTQTAVDVLVFGPNLKDQSKGEFHVHAASCKDCRNYGPGSKLGGEEGLKLKAVSRADTVRWIYFDQFAESPETPTSAYERQVHFAPCLEGAL